MNSLVLSICVCTPNPPPTRAPTPTPARDSPNVLLRQINNTNQKNQEAFGAFVRQAREKPVQHSPYSSSIGIVKTVIKRIVR